MRVPNGFKIDEAAWALVQGLISYWGTTSAAGNAGGTTFVCDDLANEPSYANHAAKILTGPAAGQVRDIDTHPAGTNTVTVSAAFSNATGAAQQITAGTSFVILSHSPSTAEVAALEAMVTALMADVGDASASTLGSIYAILGDPAVDLATQIATLGGVSIVANGTFTLSDMAQPEDNTRTEAGDYFKGMLLMPIAGACAYQPRLITAYAAAGGIFDLDPANAFNALPGLVDYVVLSFQTPFAPAADATEDRLPADTIGNKADTASMTINATNSLMRYLKGLVTNYTAARAGYLDELGAANIPADVDTLLSRVAVADIAQTTGTFAYAENNAAEQTLASIAVAARSKVGGIWLDMTNVTEDTTIRIKHKIDGANYRTFTALSWLTTDDDGVLVGPFTAYRDIQITLQCDGSGAGNVNVPYAVV
jgi:hypothetical protein